jgi:hypothetical protein
MNCYKPYKQPCIKLAFAGRGGHFLIAALMLFLAACSSVNQVPDQAEDVTLESASDLIVGEPEEQDRFGWSETAGDFNGDGYQDLAVGVPFEDIGGVGGYDEGEEGAVNIFYGSSGGLKMSNDHLLQESVVTEGNQFGRALASGDFNNDGRDDLAVSMGHAFDGAGAVQIVYGTAAGLYGTSSYFHQNSHPNLGVSEASDGFGYSLASGDFNSDGYADLGIGVPFEDIESAGATSAGEVNILYGSSVGLTGSGSQVWHQGSTYIEGNPETGDRYGFSLASGDFNNDGRDDLAIGVPDEDIEATNATEAGAVNILFGSINGLTANNDQIWTQDSSGSESFAQDYENYGFSLASGDFNNDGCDDLAIGVTEEDVNTTYSAGAVNILYGSNSGLTTSNDQFWTQDSPWIEGVSENADYFGYELTVGYFNNDNYADLAIGAPYEDVGQISTAGAVNILYGSASGLAASGDQIWHENQPNVPGSADIGNNYGAALAAGDFNGDGLDDLSVGVPGEYIYGIDQAGAVNILYGANNGLATTSVQFLFQD